MARASRVNVGDVFGRWAVQTRAPNVAGRRDAYWVCRCTCGSVAEIRSSALVAGKSTSCGCYAAEVRSANSTTHGQTNTSLYHIWCGIKARCEKPQDAAFHRYGGRGIKLCPSWKVFENFAADMGPRPSEKHTIERKRNNEGYYEDNCVWATYKEQGRNKSNNIWVTYQGVRMLLMDAVALSGLPYTTLTKRLEAGWSEDRLFTPKRNQNANHQ